LHISLMCFKFEELYVFCPRMFVFSISKNTFS
jgi:hypothetical protein